MSYLENAPEVSGSQRDDDGGLKVDGFRQVLELLHAADPAFRESLLMRLAGRDSRLAASLRDALRNSTQ